MRLPHPMKILLCCLFSTIIFMIFLGVYPLSPSCDCSNCDRQKSRTSKLLSDDNIARKEEWPGSEAVQPHSLCVLVPFRDRLEELLEFIPHMNSFLTLQRIRHKIYIINQVDSHRFNRASLINVGFLESRGSCDYIAMHDVDLLPLNNDLKYEYPEKGPYHIASPSLHPRYHYKTFVGGILLLRRDHFQLVNGLSNRYWGWGLEDDEFYVRMKNAKLNISRPVSITTGTKDTFLHLHDRSKRKRDTAKHFNQKEVTRKRDRLTGLSTVQYKLSKRYKLAVDGSDAVMLNVELVCNYSETPWCDNPIDVKSTSNNKTS